MRQNLHELPGLMRFAAETEMESLFIPHLCHDVCEWSQPAHHRPMRDFVPSQTMLEADQDRVERYFGPAWDVISKLGVNLRPSRGRPRAQPPGTPRQTHCNWPGKHQLHR